MSTSSVAASAITTVITTSSVAASAITTVITTSSVAASAITTSSSKTPQEPTPVSSATRTTNSQSPLTSFDYSGTDSDTPSGFYHCTPQDNTAATRCELRPPLSNSGLKAGIGVMVALFAIALAAFVFLLIQRRKGATKDSENTPSLAGGAAEKVQIETLQQQLEAAQSTIIATTTSRPTPIDDRTIASHLDRLAQEIKDWSITNFSNGQTPDEFPPDLVEMLSTRMSGFESLLSAPKTRALVIRAAVSAFLERAFDDGTILPGGRELRATEKGMAQTLSDSKFNTWRCSTYTTISTSLDQERDLLASAEPLAQTIDSALAPFANIEDTGERSTNLRCIVHSFATLTLTLLSQPARFYPLVHQPNQAFSCEIMEDVMQEHETKFSDSGVPENELNGRPIKIVVVWGLAKRGNGELGDDADWDNQTVVAKSKVLV